MTFSGFPPAAMRFYQDLEQDNSKAFWSSNVEVYQAAVKAPMLALLQELEAEFGTAKVFRPNRDVRFSADKSPYKTHQGSYVPTAEATGWYVQINADGLMVGGGCYNFSSARLASFRAAIDHDLSGPELERIVKELRDAGWEIGGDKLASKPRGFSADHPRIELLRHKSLTVGRHYGEPDWLHTPEVIEHVRADWQALEPLLDWFDAHVSEDELG